MTQLSGFRTPLQLEELPNDMWMLLGDLVYESLLGGLIVASKGFVTDLASVPRLPFIFWLFGDRARRAAVIHDYLYQTHFLRDRGLSDAVFLEAMKAEGVTWWARRLMWRGVQAGGAAAWASGPGRFRCFCEKAPGGAR